MKKITDTQEKFNRDVPLNYDIIQFSYRKVT